ncbi:MAG TPA: terminase small subunit [Rhodospirillales bacterium]
MNPDTWDDAEGPEDFDPADWPPYKPGRPYGVYPTPPGRVCMPKRPTDSGTGRPAEGPAPPIAAGAASAGRGPAPSPEPNPLLRRQERFCQLFAVTGNATTAAYQAGYKFEAARNQGYRLLRRPEIQARVAELQRELARAINFDAEVTLARLEAVYRQAIEGGYLNAAARVVEMQARIAGQLRSKATLPPAPTTPENDSK